MNGLSVLEIGGYAFGKPVRITASAALGKAGIINIERESNLSGRFHDKGMQIIAGYLRSHFAQDKPLSLAASICFEQSYSGVDGDSASSTEIYALLSALSDCPIRQEFAVTGSVNQQGDIQPIGGVNQKIEGFYDVCRIEGTHRQARRADSRRKCRRFDAARRRASKPWPSGNFTSTRLRTIEQGIEILTGTCGWDKGSSGKFDPDSVFGKADARLSQMAMTLRDFK